LRAARLRLSALGVMLRVMATRRTRRGSEVVVIAPTRCPNGHPLASPNVQVFTQRDDTGETRICWPCWTCEAVVVSEGDDT
jgi:hypothetical protein